MPGRPQVALRLVQHTLDLGREAGAVADCLGGGLACGEATSRTGGEGDLVASAAAASRTDRQVLLRYLPCPRRQHGGLGSMIYGIMHFTKAAANP